MILHPQVWHCLSSNSHSVRPLVSTRRSSHPTHPWRHNTRRDVIRCLSLIIQHLCSIWRFFWWLKTTGSEFVMKNNDIDPQTEVLSVVISWRKIKEKVIFHSFRMTKKAWKRAYYWIKEKTKEQGTHSTGKTGKMAREKHREFGNVAKTQGIWFVQVVHSLILKVIIDISIFAAKTGKVSFVYVIVTNHVN